MLIDTHCHLNFFSFNIDLDQVIKRAQKKGIEKIIVPGAKIDSSKKAVEIASRYPNCYAAVGIHPHHTQNININNITSQISTFCDRPKVIAIGEIGLDYHKYKGYPKITNPEKKIQKKILLLHLNLAKDKNLPIILHSRDAFDDLLDLLDSFIKQSKKHKIKGVFHCFEGNKNHLRKILNLDFHVGYNGCITYPENSHLINLVKKTPLSKLLLETDSPFLTPVPLQGTRNEPVYLHYIAKNIAKIHGRKKREIAQITSYNAENLFNL